MIILLNPLSCFAGSSWFINSNWSFWFSFRNRNSNRDIVIIINWVTKGTFFWDYNKSTKKKLAVTGRVAFV